jgi:hypothetical protein
MNCNDVDRMLIGKPGAEPLSPEAEEHVRNCNLCHSLSAAVAPEMPSPETIHRIEQRLRSDLRVVRPLRGPRYFVAWFIAIFLAAASLLTYLWGAAAIVVMSPGQITGILAVLSISSVCWRIRWRARCCWRASNAFLPADCLWRSSLSPPLLLRFSFRFKTSKATGRMPGLA